jgi:hypothetical protein
MKTFVAIALLLSGLTVSTAAQEVLVEEYRFGDFQSAHSIAVDQFGHIFISDAGASLLRKYSIRGELLAEVGGPGWGGSRFDQLRGVDASLGIAVYAADHANRRIVRLDRELNIIGSLSGESVTPSFGYPVDVVASSFETLYILDSENARVVAVDGFNSVSRVFGGMDAGSGRLRDPVAMAVGGSDMLYVLESQRVVAFDLFGGYRFHFGQDVLRDARGISAGDGRVLVVTDSELYIFSAAGETITVLGPERFLLSRTGEEFRDVARSRGNLLLLTNRSCIITSVN